MKKPLIIVIFLTLGMGATRCTREQHSPPPNIVLIICDDLNDYSGAFGGHSQARTPNLDRLASSAVRFSNAHSNFPVCAPSRNSLFSGVYPHVSGDFRWTPHYEQEVLQHNKNLIEYLGENGYYTLGSGKLQHWNEEENWDQWGWDLNVYGPFAFDGEERVGHPSVPEPFRSIGPVDGSYAPLSDVPQFPLREDGKPTGWVYGPDDKMLNYVDEENRDPLPDEWHASWAARKIEELEQAEPSQPFFLGIGFVRPHTPLYAPKRFFDMFPIDELELSEILENDAEDTHYKDLYPASIKGLRYYRTLKESYGGDAEEGLKHFLQAYLACVAFVDEQVGKVVDAIDNSRFRENTVIIFTADHGWQMGEKDYLFKMSPWEESTRIPLLIRAPGAKRGSTVEHPVSLIDLWPTIAELGHLKGDNRKDEKGAAIGGHSLVSFLQDPASGDWEGPDGALSMIGGKSEGNVYVPTFSYRTRDWRYIRYYDGSEELYHNSSDPYEWNNLAEDPAYAQQKAALSTKMDALIPR